jgi:hypothetical protein
MMTVVASAFGPLLLGASKDHWGSYVPLFYGFAPVVAVLGVAAWFTPAGAPRPESSEAAPAVSQDPDPNNLASGSES